MGRAPHSLYSNAWDNGSQGNYWSNYTGTDNNGDGIGDTPYLVYENNQDNYPLMNPIIPTTHESEVFLTTLFIGFIGLLAIVGLVFWFLKSRKYQICLEKHWETNIFRHIFLL